MPAKVTEKTLRLLLTASTSDRSVRKIAIAQLIFDHRRKFMSKKIQKKREQGRYVIVFNCQAVSKNVCPKKYATLSETNILQPSKVSSILKIWIVFKIGC